MPGEVVGVRVRLEHACEPRLPDATPRRGTARSQYAGSMTAASPVSSSPIRYDAQPRPSSTNWRKITSLEATQPGGVDHDSSVRRAARLIPIVVAAALAAPAAALAHANLVDTQPENRAVLARAPARVVVRLRRRSPGRAGERGGSQRRRVGARRQAERARSQTLVLPLRDGLVDGDYSVRWSAVSDDGHIVQGVLAFSVGTGRAPPAPTLRVTNEVGFGTRLLARGSSSPGCSSARAWRSSTFSCGGRSRGATSARAGSRSALRRCSSLRTGSCARATEGSRRASG